MSSRRTTSQVLLFPADARARREQLLKIAAAVIPVLHAAQTTGNTTMLERVFAALGALPETNAVLAHLADIQTDDAEVVPLRASRGIRFTQ